MYPFQLFRTIACVSVVTVLSVSIIIWICIVSDDTSMSEEPFMGIQLGL